MRFGKLSERDGATKDQTHDAGTGEVTLAGSSDGTCDGTIIIISRDKVNCGKYRQLPVTESIS